MNNLEQSIQDIGGVVIQDDMRLDFLPAMFNQDVRLAMLFETLVCHITRQLCKSYKGGKWEFVEVSTEGASPVMFMVYDEDPQKKLHVVHAENYFDGYIDTVTLSIAVNMMALSTLLIREKTMDENLQEKLTDIHYRLRDIGLTLASSDDFAALIN